MLEDITETAAKSLGDNKEDVLADFPRELVERYNQKWKLLAPEDAPPSSNPPDVRSLSQTQNRLEYFLSLISPELGMALVLGLFYLRTEDWNVSILKLSLLALPISCWLIPTLAQSLRFLRRGKTALTLCFWLLFAPVVAQGVLASVIVKDPLTLKWFVKIGEFTLRTASLQTWLKAYLAICLGLGIWFIAARALRYSSPWIVPNVAGKTSVRLAWTVVALCAFTYTLSVAKLHNTADRLLQPEYRETFSLLTRQFNAVQSDIPIKKVLASLNSLTPQEAHKNLQPYIQPNLPYEDALLIYLKLKVLSEQAAQAPSSPETQSLIEKLSLSKLRLSQAIYRYDRPFCLDSFPDLSSILENPDTDPKTLREIYQGLTQMKLTQGDCLGYWRRRIVLNQLDSSVVLPDSAGFRDEVLTPVSEVKALAEGRRPSYRRESYALGLLASPKALFQAYEIASGLLLLGSEREIDSADLISSEIAERFAQKLYSGEVIMPNRYAIRQSLARNLYLAAVEARLGLPSSNKDLRLSVREHEVSYDSLNLNVRWVEPK